MSASNQSFLIEKVIGMNGKSPGPNGKIGTATQSGTPAWQQGKEGQRRADGNNQDTGGLIRTFAILLIISHIVHT
jgi:hypothetical protein